MPARISAAALGLWAAAAFADGCNHERDLNAAETAFVKSRIAAAQAAWPAAPAGWVRYQADPGLESRVPADLPPANICDDFAPQPLRVTTHATYTPSDSALMKDLQWQRLDAQRKKKAQDLQAQMTAAAERGDYQAMAQYSQEMQSVSGPVGSTRATPLPDNEYEKRSEELSRKLDAAQQKNDFAAIQAITAAQMTLLMRQAGVDTGGVAAATPTPEQISAAPRAHVVVDDNQNSVEIPAGGKKISFGGARFGWIAHDAGWCIDAGGSQRAHATLLFGDWQPQNDYKNELAYYQAPAADKGSRTSVATTVVTVCGDPAAADLLLPAIQYGALK